MTLRYSLTLLLLLAAQTAWAQAPLPVGKPLLLEQDPGHYWRASLSGGPGKDGIPSIDNPRFVAADKAGLGTDDIVMGVYLDGHARAYPRKILVWHEIVNDVIGDHNIAVTYCPLTGTGVGFYRGDTAFGVSGRLVNSNVLMYDRATDTYWSQIVAAAVHGPRTGQTLPEVRVIWTTWGRWLTRHPQTEVLSQRTGFARNYRRDPYGTYQPKGGYYTEQSRPIFPTMNESPLFPAKREVFGFRTAMEAVAIDKDVLRSNPVMRFEGKSNDFLILYDEGLDTAWVQGADHGELPDDKALDAVHFTAEGPVADALEGLTPVNGFDAFWFAWYAFYPQTVILDGKNQ